MLTMSMHVSVVSVEGDRREEVSGLFEKLNYTILESFTVDTSEKADQELAWSPDRNRVAKLVYVENGFTHIVDPELVLMSDDIWIEVSARWQCRIVGWVCEGASGSYGLVVFDSGKRIRNVFRVDREVVTDEGEPLAEEQGLDWAGAFEDDVLEIVDRLGTGFDLDVNRSYVVYHLDESKMA
jgi:hypothetical protein